jgi:hypothetical protein
MRSKDWAGSGLEPVERWPSSLRTSVSTCLNSRFPILIWWGPELIKIYNDACRPMLGNKHPRSMGQRGQECWPEIWHIIGPMLEGVQKRGEPTWPENQLLVPERHGFPEESRCTAAALPLRARGIGMGSAHRVPVAQSRVFFPDLRLPPGRDEKPQVWKSASPALRDHSGKLQGA